MDLQALQKHVLTRMLRLREDGSGESKTAARGQDDDDDEATLGGGGAWKVLIFDRRCQDILAPLLNVGDLRKLGITLHMLITKQRQRVPDVPAVYFVEATPENMERIAADTERNLYDEFYLNFSSTVPKPLLSSLAERTLQLKTASAIVKVADQFCDFVSLEPKLVSLNLPNSYVHLNDTMYEERLMAYVDTLVNGIFSIAVTMGRVPIIRSGRGDVSEMVAKKLNDRIAAHIQDRNNLFAERSATSVSFHRPVLIILDRNVDLSVPLHHPWTYSALLSDTMGMRANRVTVDVDDGGEDGESKQRTYDLDQSDDFWMENGGLPFPTVAENVEQAVKQYKQEMADINAQGSSSDGSALLGDGGADDLSNTISRLPELQRRKKLIDMHTTVATAILKQIKGRELDAYFSLEEDSITGGVVSDDVLLEKLGPEGKGTLQDKLRFLLIYFVTHDVSTDRLETLKDAIKASAEQREGTALPAGFFGPLQYVQKLKFARGLTAPSPQPSDGGGRDGGHGAGGGESSTMSLFSSLTAKVYGKGVGLLADVRNLLPSSKNLPVTRITDKLMENKPNTGDEFRYFDPKNKLRTAKKGSQSTKDAFVFVLGGGNYVEYQNLQEYAKKTSTPQLQKSIAYGSTEILSPADFLRQLDSIGKVDEVGLD